MVETTSNKSHKWLIIIGIILASVVLFFAMLPSILSSQWGKERAIGLAAPHIPGTVSVDSWSLSWFGDQNIVGVSYADAKAGIQIDTASITVAKGLTSFLTDRGDIGTVTVFQPDIQISLTGPSSDAPGPEPQTEPNQKSTDKIDSSQSNSDKASQAEPIVFPPISGRLFIQEGTINIIRPGNDTEPLARDINIEVDIASLSEDITYSLALSSPDDTGNISGNGKIVLQQADTIMNSVRPAGDLLITTWDISQLLDLAAIYGSTITGGGILDSKLTFAGSLTNRIGIDGTIDLSNLELSGGPLGEDQPFIEKTSVVFSASTDLKDVELSSLQLSSPLANGNLSAAVDADGALQLSADLGINLPKVADQIPRTLNLQEGLQITDGILELKAEANSEQGENTFGVDAQVEGLAGVRDTKKISLAEPFTFSLKGQQGESGLSLEHFSIQSSFLEGEGQGNLNDMQISLQADIGTALLEMSKFISLQEYQADGLLTLSLEAQRTDESTVGLAARIDADELILKQDKSIIIPPTPLKMEVDSDLLLSHDFIFGGVADVKLAYQTWLGSGSLMGQDILVDADQKMDKVGNLAANGQLKLLELGNMLKSLGVISKTFILSGSSDFQFKVSGEKGRFLVEDLLIDSPKLSLQKGKGWLIPESPLKIQGTGEVTRGDDGSITTFDKPQFSYQSWLGSGNVEAAAMDIATKRIKALAFTGKTDLGQLAALFDSLEILPPDVHFSGMETSTLKMNYSPEQIDLTSLHTEIENFIFKQDEKSYQDKRLVIDAAGAVNMENRQASFSPVHLDSANGAVSFEQLVIGDWNNLLDTLNSNGQAQFDLNTLLGAAQDWVSLPPDVSTAAAVNLNWTADILSKTEHRYQFSADLNNFSLGKADIQTFSDEQVSVQLNGLRDPSSGSVALDTFIIESPLLNLHATGSLSTSTGKDTEITSKGDLGMDLERVASLIRTFTEIDLEMAGKSERPFELGIKVSQEQQQKWWQHTDFKGTFQADLIKMMGVELRSLEIPIQVTDGYAQAKVHGSVNQGVLQLEPHVNLVSSPPVLSLPDNSLVLDKMQITREMADQLLSRIHPLFMGATQMSGSVDLNLERFSWPLGKENLNDLQFAGSMDFNDVRLDSSALLGSLLQVLRVEETGLDLSGQQIQFVCKDGRITTNPLRTNLSDSELIISGSLGLDTTIDYLAQAEVTEQLVGRDLYQYLEGTVIHVPIGGTLSTPDISAQTVQRAVADLINQAGQKKLQDAAGSLLKKLF